jgi:ribonuclease HI
MTYFMEIYVDGGCRDNGKPGSYGAAAACFKLRSGRWKDWKSPIQKTERPRATNPRAELIAIIIALQKALQKYYDLNNYPHLEVTIHSDSQYAIGCITKWVYKWSQNGWISIAGNPIANQDLIEEASDLNERLEDLGTVEYIYVPREENKHADQVCRDVMDNMLQEAELMKAY